MLLDCLESVRVPRVMSAGVLGLLSVKLDRAREELEKLRKDFPELF